MNTFVSRGLWFTVILGGLSLAGVGAANANDLDTSGNSGLASGDLLGISINAPVSVVGNSIAGIGDALTSAPAASAPPSSPSPAAFPAVTAVTSGEDGIASGDVVAATATVPVTVADNAISVIGDPTSAAPAGPAPAAPAPAATSTNTTSGDDSLLGGLLVLVGVNAPVTVAGNAVSVIGDSSTTGAPSGAAAGSGTSGAGNTTSGDDSLLGGLLVLVGVNAPVVIGCNSISIIGGSTTGCATLVDPVTPVTPVTSVTPVTPATPVAPVVSQAGSTTTSANSTALQLAHTGSDVGGGLLAGLLAILAGLGALVFARRRHVEH